MAFICEVKSLTNENETGQVRLAIGQVLDYVHALDSLRKTGSLAPHLEGVHAVRAVVVLERGRYCVTCVDSCQLEVSAWSGLNIATQQ